MAKKNTRPAAAGSSAATPTPQAFDPEVKIGRNGKPRKRRWYHNVVDGYRFTSQIVPDTKFWVWGSVALVLLVFVALTLLTGRWIMMPILGITLALLVGLIVLGRKISQARYAQLDGQLGGVGALLREGRRGWSTDERPVHVNARSRDLVYRAVGRPGVVLVSEGPAHRVGRLLEEERRRITRIMPEVPVHHVQVGSDEGQVHISKMWRAMSRQDGKLTANEVAVVAKRLDSMTARSAPIPKGVDPAKARMSRRSLRGR